MVEPLLRTSQLTKRYGSATVLDRADYELSAGEIHAVIGANGAGKSTLCKIIAGLIPSSSGAMKIDGCDYRPKCKQDAEAFGIEIVQQELSLIPTLSVAENLLLTRMPAMAGVIRFGELHGRAREILDRFGLDDVDTATPVGSLGVGRQQMVEISAALARDCRILILDEPTACLSAAETDRLFEWLDQLRHQGVGLIYISHRLDEISRLTDRITVLRDGAVIHTCDTDAITSDQMVELISGDNTHATAVSDAQSFATNVPALRVESISCGPVQNVSFTVFRGQRLGIAGLVGAGRTELLRAIFGADRATAGYVRIGTDESRRQFRSPHEAVQAGLAMVTEDRKANGLLLSQSIRANTTLASLGRSFSRGGMIRQSAELYKTNELCQSLETVCTSTEQTVAALSGGNQQKVAVSRWLLRNAEVFLFDEPTRGIDIAARRRIYRLFDSLAAAGKGIVIVSSDLEELLETCDRIAVMSAGRLVRMFDRGTWSEEAIMQAAFSGYLENQASQDAIT